MVHGKKIAIAAALGVLCLAGAGCSGDTVETRPVRETSNETKETPAPAPESVSPPASVAPPVTVTPPASTVQPRQENGPAVSLENRPAPSHPREREEDKSVIRETEWKQI